MRSNQVSKKNVILLLNHLLLKIGSVSIDDTITGNICFTNTTHLFWPDR